MPKTTLSDVRDHAAAVAPTGSGAVPEAVHFAIYVDSYRVAPDVAVAVPAEHIWWLAEWEDVVLLSVALRTTAGRPARRAAARAPHRSVPGYGRWELMCKDGQIARRLEQRARELATIAKSSPVARERNPGEHATYEACCAGLPQCWSPPHDDES